MIAHDAHLDLSRGVILQRWLRRAMIRRAMCRNPSVAFCAPADGIGVEVLSSGTFEGEYLAFLEVLVGAYKGDKSAVAIDVGANIGTHSLFLSRIFARVLSFEPNPAVCLVCKANQACADVNNVEVFDVALSNASGNAMLYTPTNGNFGWGSLDTPEGRKATVVRTERGDDFILPRLQPQERVVLVKIDVERHEAQVIEGLSVLLSKHQPLVLFESLGDADFRRSRAVLERCGYNAYYAITRTWDGRGALGKFLSLLGRNRIYLSRCGDGEAHRQTAILAVPEPA